jgi:hypothetical protein
MVKNGASGQKISLPSPPPLLFAPTYFDYSCATTKDLRQIKPVIDCGWKNSFSSYRIFSIILFTQVYVRFKFAGYS